MSVGIAVAKVDVDGRLGGLVGQLWRNLDEIRRFKAWLDDSAHNDAYLTGLGYTAGEITTLRAAMTDLDNLRKLSHATAGGLGVANVGSTAALSDFWFQAKNLTGVDFSG